MNQERIGKWIALLRRERQLTQEQLAERLGVSSRSVSRWENGRCMPDYSLLWDIAKELDVSVAELLNGKRAEGEEKTDISDSIRVLFVWSEREKQHKAKKLGKYFGAGMACLLLALLQAQFKIVSILFPEGPKDLETGILAAMGAISGLSGFICNRRDALLTQKEVELLLKEGRKLRMKKAQEMLLYAQKYRAADQKCFKAAFTELEKNLEEDESAVFSAVGDSYARNGLQMMWYTVLAVTETRLFIGGQRMKGMIMVHYEVESFPLHSVTRVEQEGASMLIQVSGAELEIEEGSFSTAARIVEELRKVIRMIRTSKDVSP